MHTAFELKKNMFVVQANGQPIERDALLGWEVRDRLGVLIDRPVGALGAGLLILLAITAFYDMPGKRRRTHPLYPDIFLFHVGGAWGPFINFDFWPDHKEIFVAQDAGEVLRAINHRGITHLAVPDKPSKGVRLPFKEPEAAIDRIKQCYVYDPSGSVRDADVSIETTERVVMRNFRSVLDLETVLESTKDSEPSSIPMKLQSPHDDEALIAAQRMRQRVAQEIDKDHPEYRAAVQRLEAAEESGRLAQTVRRTGIEEILGMLA